MKALYSEITTGMSAPPIGRVISTPSASASTKNARIHGIAKVCRAIAPHTTATSATAALNHCWPGKV